jgi:ribosomal-protein-alanine N-acetyltransferase
MYTLWEPHKSVEDSLDYIKDYVFQYYSQGVPEPLGITLKNEPSKVIGTVGCFWVSKSAKSIVFHRDQYWDMHYYALTR